MPLTRAEIARRYRAAHPEKIRERNKRAWQEHKLNHPEIGTHESPRRDTRFKPGDKKRPGAGKEFQPGHQINKGRPAWNKGQRASEETRQKIREARARQVISDETRLAMSRSHRARREQCPFWKGGITEQNKSERNRVEYKLWRESVFRRDDYTCQHCGKRGGSLHADHVKPFAHFHELRFDVSNGRTLCVSCHKQTDTYLGKAARREYAEVS